MFAVRVLFVFIFISAIFALTDKDVKVTFRYINHLTDEEDVKHIFFDKHTTDLPSIVIETCRRYAIYSPGCFNIFQRAVNLKVAATGTLLGNEVTDQFVTFSRLYTYFILNEGTNERSITSWDMDNLLPSSNALNYVRVERLKMTATKMVLCISHHSEDLSWLATVNVPFVISSKTMSQSVALTVPVNRGNEVSSYLRYIIEYYDCLPEYTVFLHGHNEAWHQYYNINFILHHLDWSKPYQNINNAVVEYHGTASAQLRALWPELFQEELGETPTDLREKCCAQFMVHRDRIRLRSKQFYTRLYDYALLVDDADISEDGYHSSVSYVMEMVWHVVFGEAAHMRYDSGLQMLSTDVYGQQIQIIV